MTRHAQRLGAWALAFALGTSALLCVDPSTRGRYMGAWELWAGHLFGAPAAPAPTGAPTVLVVADGAVWAQVAPDVCAHAAHVDTVAVATWAHSSQALRETVDVVRETAAADCRRALFGS